MKIRLSLTLSLLLITFFALPQGALVWHFGQNGKIDFTSLPPATFCNSQMFTGEGSSGVTTDAGSDLFYTDGRTVWNTNNSPMPNGNGTLKGNASSTSSAIVVPDPGNSSRYYIFTTDQEEDQAAGAGFNHAIVDMTLNGGLGDVIIPAGNPIHDVSSGTAYPTEKLTVIPNASNDGYWIIIGAAKGTNTFHSYELTAAGLNFTPVISNVGFALHSQGYLKANLIGSHVAVASYGLGIELISFDRFTGALTNAVSLSTNPLEFHYGIEFSPDGSVLYASSLWGAAGSASAGRISSFDLTASNIASTQKTVFTSAREAGALSIGPDGKIYFAHNSGDWSGFVGAINDPNNFDVPAVNGNALSFPCSAVFRGLPTHAPSLILDLNCEPPSDAVINSDPVVDVCEGEQVTLTANLESGYIYFWINTVTGDTVTGFQQDEFTVTESGEYTLTIADLVDINDTACSRSTDTIVVNVNDNPVITGSIDGKDLVCTGETNVDYVFTDDNSGSFSSIVWQDPTNGAVYTSTVGPNATVSFENITSTDNPVVIGVHVTQDFGLATCTSAVLEKTIDFEAIPDVSIAGPERGCPDVTGNTYDIVATGPGLNFSWSVEPVSAGFFNTPTDQSGVNVNLPNLAGETINVKVSITDDKCNWEEVLVHEIVVDTAYEVSYSIPDPILCGGEAWTFELEVDVTNFDNDSFTETALNAWGYNGENVAVNVNEYVHSDVLEGDSLIVLVVPQFCYTESSKIVDTVVVQVNELISGVPVINESFAEHTIEGIEEIRLSDTSEVDRIDNSLTSPESWQWLYFDEQEDKLVLIDSSDVYFTSTTPPVYNQANYDVNYYLVTFNGVCYDTSTVVLHVEFDLFVPTAFSPNNDGSFDDWHIKNIEKYPNASVLIYNRWGNKVAELDDISVKDWRGDREGEALSLGTYYYILSLNNEEGTVLNGNVSILK